MNNPVSVMARVRDPGLFVRQARQLLLRAFSALQHGQLHICFDDGEQLRIAGDVQGPAAHLAVHDPLRLLRALTVSGDLGFAEAYMDGAWTSDDLAGLLYLISMNLDALGTGQRRSLPVRWLARMRHALNRNSRIGSRRNIAAHYDLGNDFYARWLDGSMSYSSAVFDQGSDLEQAQWRKYQLMFEMIDPAPGERILEIGCGWGGFAEYAAARGVHVTGVTLSQQQYHYAAQRIRDAGLEGKVDLRLTDYRNLHETFDHIVSIEMFEAVGRDYWQTYFDVLQRCLRPGGRVALQVITIREDLFDAYVRQAGGFIQRYIFPGGMLPTEQHLLQLGESVGMEALGLQRYGEDYADTLAEWRSAFADETEWLQAHGYDRRFRRMWDYYLAFCEAGFRDGRIDLVQLCLHKEGPWTGDS